MLKKFLLILFLISFASPAFSQKGANIFAYPRKAPTSKIYNRYGKSFSLYDFAGDFLVAVFWSKTCIPCLKEMDDLNEFSKKTADTGIKVIIISPDKEWLSSEEQYATLKKYGGFDLDFYTDKGSKLSNDFGIFTSPHTVLINRDSMEIGRIRGSVDWDDQDVIEYIYKIKAQN